MIVIVSPTILDGPVYRWYRDVTGAEINNVWMSASRNGVRVKVYLHEIPDEDMLTAQQVYQSLLRGEEPDIATHVVNHAPAHRRGVMARKVVPVDRRTS